MIYSPLPMDDYRLVGSPKDHIDFLLDTPWPQASWNYLWLSIPGLDNVPGAGKQWFKGYKPVPGSLAAAMSDVEEDIALRKALEMPPSKFLAWFSSQTLTAFDMHAAAGGDAWVEEVKRRGAEAQARLEVQIGRVGNVYNVDFRRKAA